MKTTIEKFWWGKVTSQRLNSNQGIIDQRKSYLFGKRGLCIWTVNNPVTISENLEETALCQILAERQVSYSELTAKKNADEKAENDRKISEENAKKEAQKLANAPIKEQLNKWVDNFSIELPNSELLNNEKALLIKSKFDAFKKWAKSEIESM